MWFSEIVLWHAHMQGEGTRMCVPQGQEITHAGGGNTYVCTPGSGDQRGLS